MLTCSQSHVNKQTWGTAGMVLMACQAESGTSFPHRRPSTKLFRQRYWRPVSFLKLFIVSEWWIVWSQSAAGQIWRDWLLTVKDLRGPRQPQSGKPSMRDLSNLSGMSYIKLLYSYNAMIHLPHSFLQGKKNIVNPDSTNSARQTVTHFLTTPRLLCQNATSVDHKF